MLAQRVVQLEIVDSASARSQGTAGGGVGLCEIGLVFWPEVQNFEANESGLYGLGLSVVATLLASLGDIASRPQPKGWNLGDVVQRLGDDLRSRIDAVDGVRVRKEL